MNVGECFEVADLDLNTVYMKIAERADGCVCVKALDIVSGYVTDCPMDFTVTPVRAKAVIE